MSNYTECSGHGVKITITPSGGSDGGIVVFIDTDFEPDGSDDGPGLRVIINDHDTYTGIPFEAQDDES